MADNVALLQQSFTVLREVLFLRKCQAEFDLAWFE
jgi:hypothetical protein